MKHSRVWFFEKDINLKTLLEKEKNAENRYFFILLNVFYPVKDKLHTPVISVRVIPLSKFNQFGALQNLLP